MTSGAIAVLGAGIQGCSVALALAERGHRMDLYDRDQLAVAKASFWNEGKLHLGYVLPATTQQGAQN